MYTSSLGPKARDRFSGKRHAGKLARVVWEGGDGKGVNCTTSPAPYFILRWQDGVATVLPPGAGGKGSSRYLAISLPYQLSLGRPMD